MNRWKMFWACFVASVFGLSLWSNRRLYRNKSWTWVGVKSLFDAGLVLALAMKIPVLLCGYVCVWLTRPFKDRPVLRTTLGTLIGLTIGVLSAFSMEAVVVLGIFAVDLVSGGIVRYWNGIGAETIDWKAEIGLRRKAA